MKLTWLAALPLLAAAGCTTYQTVSPVDPVDSIAAIQAGQSTLFCVIDNPVVGSAFIDSFRTSLIRRGFDVKLLPPGAPVASCPLSASYYVTRQTVWRPFVASADITIYRNGERVGKAIYDAQRGAGGINVSNFADPAWVIEGLVDKLFPGLRPPEQDAAAAAPATPAAPAAPAPPAGYQDGATTAYPTPYQRVSPIVLPGATPA